MSILPESALDRRILRAAAKYATPDEMSEAVLGQLTPAQCAERLKELLSSKTVLDEVQERRLLLVQMSEHLDWIKNRRNDDKSWSAISRMFKLVSDQIERTNVEIEDISTRLSEAHAQYFIDGIMVGMQKVFDFMRERDMIVVDAEDQVEMIEVGVHASSEYLQKVTAKNVDEE